MKTKAQVSVEFLMVIGVVALGFIVAIAMIFGFIGDTLTMKENTGLKELGETISREVTMAKSVADNYEKEFTLPSTVEGIPYEISINHYNPPKTLYSEIILTFKDSDSLFSYKKIVFLYNVDVASINTGTNMIKKDGTHLYVCNVDAIEICDGRDNDCDDLIDEGCDSDQDGYIDVGMSCDVDAGENILCADDSGSVSILPSECITDCVLMDCNDNDPTVFYGETEICDGIDNDCDDGTGSPDNDYSTGIDEGCDSDQDGYIDANMGCDDTTGKTIICADNTASGLEPSSCHATCSDRDCNDDSALDEKSQYPGTDCSTISVSDCENIIYAGCGFCIHPTAWEREDAIDNNCNDDELVWDNNPATGIDEDITDMYCDYDGDGFKFRYDAEPLPPECVDFPIPSVLDCDDSRDDVNPDFIDVITGSVEKCDGVDNDCDGVIDNDCDQDNDGYVNPDLTCEGTPKCGLVPCTLGCDNPDCDDTSNLVTACANVECQTPSCGESTGFECVYTNVEDVTCNDKSGLYCNGLLLEERDYSCSGGSCSYAITATENCDKGIACVTYGCAQGALTSSCTVISSTCPCDAIDTLDPDCDYLDSECTDGYCDSQRQCVVQNKVDGVTCTDNNACTSPDTCLNGVCKYDIEKDCSDGDACNGLETCRTTDGVCISGTDVSCSTGSECVGGSCCKSVGTTCTSNSQCCDGSCGRYNCNPHDCNCGWTSCDTCYDNCYKC